MKKICITIDDIPVQAGLLKDRYVMDGILSHLEAYRVPATGFVIGAYLFERGMLSYDQVRQVERWIKAGCDVGNHGFLHKSYSEVGIDEYFEDIRKGHKIISELFTGGDKEVRYFRGPFLDTGDSPERKTRLQQFLDVRGYKLAPVTVDGWDWKFNLAYEEAWRTRDCEKSARVTAHYVQFTREALLYREIQSARIFGYEMPQVLLLHANLINANCLGMILQMLRELGYAFVGLDEALSDKSYYAPDVFYERGGLSWLDRWVFSFRAELQCEALRPVIPACVEVIKGKAEP